METFQLQGPLGTIKCVVEQDRSAGRQVLLLHCEGDAVVPVHQARRNKELLGACCEAHIFPGGDHSIALYNEEAGEILASWLQAENKE